MYIIWFYMKMFCLYFSQLKPRDKGDFWAIFVVNYYQQELHELHTKFNTLFTNVCSIQLSTSFVNVFFGYWALVYCKRMLIISIQFREKWSFGQLILRGPIESIYNLQCPCFFFFFDKMISSSLHLNMNNWTFQSCIFKDFCWMFFIFPFFFEL